MKVFFGTAVILSVIYTFSWRISAQELVNDGAENPLEKPKVTIKVDEFGSLKDCDTSARVDNLFVQLNNFKDAKGYIITYSGVDLLPSQLAEPPILIRIKR